MTVIPAAIASWAVDGYLRRSPRHPAAQHIENEWPLGSGLGIDPLVCCFCNPAPAPWQIWLIGSFLIFFGILLIAWLVSRPASVGARGNADRSTPVGKVTAKNLARPSCNQDSEYSGKSAKGAKFGDKTIFFASLVSLRPCSGHTWREKESED
jgi:hypothetical protein